MKRFILYVRMIVIVSIVYISVYSFMDVGYIKVF